MCTKLGALYGLWIRTKNCAELELYSYQKKKNQDCFFLNKKKGKKLWKKKKKNLPDRSRGTFWRHIRYTARAYP